MKVTQAIRDYIYGEIQAKYDAKLDAEFGAYIAKKDELAKLAQVIIDKANEDILALCKDNGFSPDSYSGSYRSRSSRFVSGSSSPYDGDTEDRMHEMRRDFNSRISRKVNEVCFDLEIGGAKKEEIRGILDSIEV